jgi:uncharacterized protein (TIGR02246 family)
MSATTPEQVYDLLKDAFDAGDIERLMALYEADAVLVAQPGENMAGTEQVRAALEGFLALKGRLSAEMRTVVQAGDLALASVGWSVTGTGPDGNSITLSGVSADVLRQQADGSWRYVIDHPWGDQVTQAG